MFQQQRPLFGSSTEKSGSFIAKTRSGFSSFHSSRSNNSGSETSNELSMQRLSDYHQDQILDYERFAGLLQTLTGKNYSTTTDDPELQGISKISSLISFLYS